VTAAPELAPLPTVAALYVDPRGAYANQPGVEVWDEARDARLYAGPWPVVAHPPCAAWCTLATLREIVHGLPRGEDGGCFSAALASVRAFGGVLEHPADSAAFRAHGLPRPTRGAWTKDITGGWACEVHQSAYGHSATKRTWLYYIGTSAPPVLDWSSPPVPMAIRTGMSSRRGTSADANARRRPRGLRRTRASATPPIFRDLLIAIARGAS